MKGTGAFTRDVGTLPPSTRKMLEQVGNEPIQSITLFRKPISQNNIYQLAKQFKLLDSPYDSLYHIGMVINGKYVLEKNEYIKFYNGEVPSGSETYQIRGNNKSIQEMFDKTRQRMGDRFTEYDASENNCQDFLYNALLSIGLLSNEASKFIKQDVISITKQLPSIVSLISKLGVGIKQFWNRQQEGEGLKQKGGCSCSKDSKDEIQYDYYSCKNNNLPMCKISM